MQQSQSSVGRRSKHDGFGYAYTPFRLEFRPQHRLHTREELLAILDQLYEQGVKAWWYSAAARGSYPLFASKYLPHREDADTELYRWLVREAHARDIALFSWEYLNTAPLLTAGKPEWRYRYFEEAGREGSSVRDSHFVCHNSPYGELLKAYCVEVTKDLGFDGLWFDGCYMHSDDSGRMACRCSFCSEAFKRDTGFDIPERIDFRSGPFKRFMEWRYENVAGYWRGLSEYVRTHTPEAIVVFNFFNRFGHNERSGNPLRTMPMEGMIASESCSKPYQLILQHKTLTALNKNYPPEVWDYFRDAAQNSAAVPEPEPSAVLFHAQCSAAAGGYASFGFEAAPAAYRHLIGELVAALNPIAPYIGGEQPGCIGLVLSGATKDYAHVKENGAADSWPTWRAVHGMHNLLNALHVPSDVVLDDMLNVGVLETYKAVVLPDVRCLSDEAAAALQHYAEQGGLLIMTGRVGTMNEYGDLRERGVMDDWFGVCWRDADYSRPLLDLGIGEQQLAGFPRHVMVGGDTTLIRTEGCEVLASAEYRAPLAKHSWSEAGIAVNPNPVVRGEAITLKRCGKGSAIWIAADIGGGYNDQPSRRTRELMRALIEPRIERPFTTDAPPNVYVSMWRRDDEVVFHLLNMPHQVLTVPERGGRTMFPEDFTPTSPIALHLPGTWGQAFSPTGASVSFSQSDGCANIRLECLERHAVIIIKR